MRVYCRGQLLQPDFRDSKIESVSYKYIKPLHTHTKLSKMKNRR